ncbi:hypothetical protein DXT68_16770 [Microbacterium foliorum]|uniref:2-oxoglutarate dehydrogenase n=1 Tax=Microbacterium foliorum TaxID=104336 RepID=A0A0F0KLG0_9MICO|nr:DUF6049 family protein [Microbacterium foliorum]AXL13594.1 hypothetical protein DXT68_16770 [Microbacterium foliorum]KJL21717.1 hypothetical protein RN50_01615 [Microbacterium foliorum]
MTATTPENGHRTRLQRVASGSVIPAIVLGLCATGTGSAVAATDADADDAPAIELILSAGVRGAIAPGSGTTASLTVQNDESSSLSAGRVTVEINRTALSSPAAVTSWLDDDEVTGDFDELGTDATGAVDAESAATTTIAVPPEALADLAPGVYPLRATLSGAQTQGQSDSDAVTSTSVLVVTATPNPPIAVIVPITATPARGALLTSEELTVLTAPDGALTAAIDGVRGTGAILAIDPAITAAVNVLGSTAPQSAREWLRQLDELPNDRFALQFGDADATTQAQAGLPSLLQPTSLLPFVNPSDFVTPAGATPSDAPTPSPSSSGTPSPSPGSPSIPSDADLRAVDGATAGVLWPRSDVTAADLDAFAGYVGDGGVTILSSASLGGAAGARATAGTSDILVSDTAASDALSDAASENDAASRQRLLSEATAQVYLSALPNPATPLLVGLDRDDTRSADALREAIAAVDSPGFGLTEVLATPSVPVSLVAEPDTSRGAALQRMLADEVVLDDFASILDDRQLLLSPKRIQILRATAVGLTAKKFDEATAAVHIATTATLDAVDIPPSSTIQLLTANADLPFSVRNDLPWPVNVMLSVRPSDPRLDVQKVTAATIQPNSNGRVKVPVSARVGSGEVTLTLELSSPTGVQISQPERVRVSVRAEWETIGLALFGGLIVLLLSVGVIRTVRRRRRESDAEAGVETDAADPHEADDVPETVGSVENVDDVDGRRAREERDE